MAKIFCTNHMKQAFLILTLIFSTLVKSYGQDIKSDRLSKLLQQAKATRSSAVIIFKNDKLVKEVYFDTVNAATKIETMSCTKSIVALAVACMQADGLINNLDEPVYKFYPEWNQGRKREVTIRHLLNMTSGIQNNPNATVEIYPSPDFVQLALCAELSTNPGENWSYNNKALNLLAGIVKKATGNRMDVYINSRLFKPLDVTSYDWTLDSAGNPHVMSGCQLAPRDFVKMGLLVLNKGSYNGKQVIGSKFVEQLTQPCDQYAGYGKLWWIDYESTLTIIDDSIINTFIRSGVSNDFISKLSQAKGEYLSQQNMVDKFILIFGPDFRKTINDNLQEKKLALFRTENRGAISYHAEGYLGNYIVVSPRDQIVAVRMISSDRSAGDETVFGDFKDLILALTK